MSSSLTWFISIKCLLSFLLQCLFRCAIYLQSNPKQNCHNFKIVSAWPKYYQNFSRLWQSSKICSSSYSRMPLHSCKFHIHSFFNSKSASLTPLQFLQLPHLRNSNTCTFKTVIVESLAMTVVFILHDPFNIASISLTIQVEPMVNADWLWFSYTAVFHILFSWWMSGCDCSFSATYSF